MTRDHFNEQDLTPFSPDNLEGRRVLVFAPHPDDESLGCGGSLIKHIAAGDPVKVVFLTDGRHGERSPDCAIEDYINIREIEARKACSVLGVETIEFWKIRDRTLGDKEGHFQKILNCIDSYDPELIYVTSPIELNPDHRAAANLVWQVIQSQLKPISIAFYEVSTPLLPNILVDITNQIDQKKQAVSEYKSQLIKINYLELMTAVNRFRSLTITEHSEYAEAFVLISNQESRNQSLLELFPIHKVVKKPDNPDRPHVSIIVRTKDRPWLLRQALESIAGQDYQNLEVIVVNDGQQDVKLITNYFKSQFKLVLICGDSGLGRSKAANVGLKHANGELIGFLDDDDLYYSNHLNLLVDELIESPDIDLVYSDCLKGQFSRKEGEIQLLSSGKKRFHGLEYDRERLYLSNYIPIITVLFRKSLLLKSGYFDDSLEVFEDWDLWIRMSQYGEFRHIPEVTCEYRVFGERSYNYYEGQMKIYEKYWHIYTPKKLMSWLHDLQAENNLLNDRINDLVEKGGNH